MAKKQFRNLKELQRYINLNVPDEIFKQGKLERQLKEAMLEAVERIVYEAYTPTTYDRRGSDGGLKDVDNMMITEAFFSGNNFKIIFENITKGNDTLSDEFLTRTIEEGIESNWQKTGEWSEPRPFMREMYENIMANPEPLIRAIKDAFIKVGFKVK